MFEKEREWDRTFDLNDFIDANIDLISDMYLDDYPEQAHRINDWDLEVVYEYARKKAKYLVNIMMIGYEENINF